MKPNSVEENISELLVSTLKDCINQNVPFFDNPNRIFIPLLLKNIECMITYILQTISETQQNIR